MTRTPLAGCQTNHLWHKRQKYSSGFSAMRSFRIALFLFMGIMGSHSVKAQTTNDQAAVLQKCMDLPALQQYFPRNSDSGYKELVVMQHGVSFPANISVTHGGDSPLFKSKGQIANDANDAYFYFNSFNVMPNSAST